MGNNPASIDDMEIYDIITALNTLPYMQTTGCCSGHLLWEEMHHPELLTRNPPFIMYQALDEQAHRLMQDISREINKIEKLPFVARFSRESEGIGKISGLYAGRFPPKEQMHRETIDFWNIFREYLKIPLAEPPAGTE